MFFNYCFFFSLFNYFWLHRSNYISMQKLKLFYLWNSIVRFFWNIHKHYFSYFSLIYVFLLYKTTTVFQCFYLPSPFLFITKHIKLTGILLYYNSELFEIWKITPSFLMSLLFPFHFFVLFAWTVIILWFSSASWSCAELTLFLVHLNSSSPFIWRFPENTSVSTQKWSLAQKEAYSFILLMDRTI